MRQILATVVKLTEGTQEMEVKAGQLFSPSNPKYQVLCITRHQTYQI
jgi:hypothetical protein